jgi:hypothetical protein
VVYYLKCFNHTVGIENVESDRIAVYPNPNSGNIYIRTPPEISEKDCWIEIYD